MVTDVLTKDLVHAQITTTSKCNGPDQVGGLSFGTSYTYYRIGEYGEWKKSEERSQFRTKTIIEHNLAADIDRLIGEKFAVYEENV